MAEQKVKELSFMQMEVVIKESLLMENLTE